MDKRQKKLNELISNYKNTIDDIGFARPEQEWLEELNEDTDPLDIIEKIIEFSVELNSVLESSPDSITVMDSDGYTLRVNKAFEETTGLKGDDVMGRNMLDLEKEGYFKPSAYGIVKKEKRTISIIQEGKNWKAITTGAPVYDSNGHFFRVVSNARSLDEISEITSYLEEDHINTSEKYKSDMIAESPAMKQVVKLAGQVAGVDSSVLITGESGVGKGMIAHWIHDNSSRRDHDMIEINCGAIPESLLESELFGYESGAFTGAAQKGKPGLIELADKGTLFLDEVGELPLALQVKLLKFLQSHVIMRIGGTKEKKVDVRVIAATNSNLEKMVEEGKFRDDLYYRLNVVPIEIPPLRKRPEDIYPAARFFADKYKKKYNKSFEFSDDFLETLIQYNWMGNMRELENYMERIVVMSGENTNPSLLKLKSDNSEEGGRKLSLQEKLDRYEAELVREAYEKYHNTYKVASELGISQASASRKINKYI